MTITSDPTQSGRRLDVTVNPTDIDGTPTTTGFDHFHIAAVSGSQTIAVCDTLNGGPNACALTPLVAGTAYKIVVQAIKADSSVALTQNLDPGTSTTPKLSPPTGVTAEATGVSGDVKVSWTPDPNVGGSTVARFTASAYLGNSTAQATCQTADGTTNNCTIHGLVNGASYNFGVVANGSTAVADSVATDPSAVTAIPGIGSAAPTDALATVDAGSGDAIVTWTPPADTTGVTYVTSISPITAVPPAPLEVCTSGGTEPIALCSNLAPGTTYTISVKAARNGVQSAAATATVRSTTVAPDDPATVTAKAGDAQVTAAWTAPATDNGVTVKGYRAIAVLHAAPTVPVATCNTTTAMTCDIKGLTNGSLYDVSVVAYGSTGTQSSALGTAAASSVTPAVQPKPGAPTVTTPAQGDITSTSATVSWTPAGAVNGAAVQYYTATATPKASGSAAGADASNPSCTAVAPSTSCTISGLLPGTAYDVKVVAYASATSYSTAGTITLTTSGSSTPGGGGMSGPIVTNRNGLSQMFARGGDSNLWTNVRDANGNWGQWTSLGGLIGSEPVAVLNGTGASARLQVFVLGFADHAVWYKLQNANDSGFGPWTQVDGSRWISKIELTKNKAGTVQVFGRGADGNLYYTVQTSATNPAAWQNWVSLGGLIASDPVVAQWDDGTLEVFAVGAGDGQIWHRVQARAGDNTSWAWWTHVAPSAAQNVGL
ncbi:fibronectin type III domain-containing protein [Dactylosporangium sp. NPDC051485]|uniref:fibronectin type III domain-containing protein n=1 Tax=Dactylosporangium sp. NPDC051485 TaxID=3154846 RepID=UPI00341B49BC